jgi:hypothetical protein
MQLLLAIATTSPPLIIIFMVPFSKKPEFVHNLSTVINLP